MLSVKNLALGGLDVNSQQAITPVKARGSPNPCLLGIGRRNDWRSLMRIGARRFGPTPDAGAEVKGGMNDRGGFAVESTAYAIDSAHAPG